MFAPRVRGRVGTPGRLPARGAVRGTTPQPFGPIYTATKLGETDRMRAGLGLVIAFVSGCNLYFGSGQDDSPPPPGPPGPPVETPDAGTMPPPPPDAPVYAGLVPVAPSATEFMWPSLQEHFRRDGVDCHGQVTLAVSDRAVCFVGSDDDLHCAGSVYTHDFGPTFAAIGKLGVDQIMLTPTFNAENGNSMCVHERDHTIECFGTNNTWGVFGNGTTDPSDTWTTFGAGHVWTRLGGIIDVRCALDDAGVAYCAGWGLGNTPVAVDGSTVHSSLYLDPAAGIHFDDPMVFRAASGSACWVKSAGLNCNAPQADAWSGDPGDVVDGTVSANPFGSGAAPVCRLDPAGAVYCTVAGITEQEFVGHPNVALAGNFYTDTRCAVASNGSLWCRGMNRYGELGIGSSTPVPHEIEVQPPGSVKLTCN